MIEIRYNNQYSFEIVFCLKDYIPEKYFNLDNKGVELNFYKYLFKNTKLFNIINYELLIWDEIYHCECNGLPFEMYYDTDWDLVSFFVEDNKYQSYVAESIKELILTKKNFSKL